MVAPSKSFTVIADSAIDADSPLTADLMEDFRDNDIHLEEWLGKNYTAAVDHDHDGVNSKTINIAASITVEFDKSTFTASGTWTYTYGGVLGFNPVIAHIRWGYFDTVPATNGYVYHGWGWMWGTGTGDSMGITYVYDYDAGNAIWHPVGWQHDVNDCMGYTSPPGANALFAWDSSFATEQARCTTFSSSNIIITTQSGGWGGNTGDIMMLVWGS